MKEENITLGTYLRTAREKKNISLEAIARATKITLRNLEALEKDELQLLPPPVFVRGFLRAYAHQVGLDEQKIMEIYERETKGVYSSLPSKKAEGEKKIPRVVKILGPILLIVLGGILFYYLSSTPPPPPSATPSPSILPSSPSPPIPPPPADKTDIFVPETETKASTAVEEAPPPQVTPAEEKKIEPPPAEPPITVIADVLEKTPPAVPKEKIKEKIKERRHVLKVRAIEKCWLQIKADEGKEVEALLQPQEIATWTARRQFKVTIGNAGGVEVTFNGIQQGRLGKSGQVVHLVLPPEIKKKTPLAEGVKEVEKKD